MQTGVSIKAGAAFLAGVVLALGGAYTYFKVADAHLQKTAQQTSKPADNPQPVPDLTPAPKPPDPVMPAPEPTPVTQPEPPKVVHPKLILPKPKVTSRPVSLASVTPAPQYQEPLTPPPDNDLPPVQTPAVTTPMAVQATPPPPPQPHTVTLAEGTTLAIRLNEKLSTDHNYSGDAFRATLDQPIIVDGFIIADRGAKVLGKIVKAQKPGKFEGNAELALTLTEISTTDGQKIEVETNQSLRKGPSNTGEEVAKMGGGAALGAIIGAIAGGGKGAAIGAGAGGAAGTGAVFLGHGKPAVLDNETRLTFQLATPTTITEHLN
jgi:hypothetical protein